MSGPFGGVAARIRAFEPTVPSLVLVLLTVLPAATLAVLGWTHRWTHDDGFINYRIVSMFRAGHGPVFNIGERVETFTSPLWMLLLSVGDLLLPMRLEWIGVVFGIGFAAAGMVALAIGARRLTGTDEDRWWIPVGVLVPLAVAPTWDFTTSGLENSLTLCWIGLVTVALGRWARAGRPPTIAEAVLVGIGPLVRPDVAIYSAVVLAVLLGARWRAESWAVRARVVGAALALPVLYQLFRMAYFAALVPNTALAKGAEVSHWREGWVYLTDLVGTYLLVVPLIVVAVVLAVAAGRLDLQGRLALVALPVAALVHTLYIVRAGGDYMHARLLLPPLLAFIAPCALVPVRAFRPPAIAAIVLVAMLGWAGLSATSLRTEGPIFVERTAIVDQRPGLVETLGVTHPVTAEQQGWGRGSERVAGIEGDAVFIDGDRLDAPPAQGLETPTMATFGIGLPGYSVPRSTRVLDRLGLADPLTARFELTRTGLIGHEKPIPQAWLNARVTDDLVSQETFEQGIGIPPLFETPPQRWADDVAAARRALDCEPLRRLEAAITEPLTPDRLLRNLVEALGHTRLAIPADPSEAVVELCN